MNSDIHKQLEYVFRSIFEDDTLKIDSNTSAKDIDMWDSLTHVELISEVEEKFNITFSFNEVMDFKNVGDMLKTIEDKTA